jgi:hypothetical protein
MAPFSRHMADMAPLNGVDGDKNGAPPFFIWQKQEMAPYGGNGANGDIWRHMAPYGLFLNGAIFILWQRWKWRTC